jgi:hypothetical protein
MNDLRVEVTDFRTELVPDRDGRTVTEMKRLTFYIGKFGPFVERVPKDASQADINAVIEKIKNTVTGFSL